MVFMERPRRSLPHIPTVSWRECWRCCGGLGLREPLAHSSGLLAEEETHPVDLSSLSSKLLPGFSFTTLGFKDERRSKGECGEEQG